MSQPSKCLQFLLNRSQRIQRPVVELEPTESQQMLLDRTKIRRWKIETEAGLKAFIEQTKGELKFAKHAPSCKQCMIQLQLDIERYLGSHCPWYLNIRDEIGFSDVEFDDEYSPHLKDMPRVKDYIIGSYWSGPSDDTTRFIKDRLDWAEKKLGNDITLARKALRTLKKWSFDYRTPQAEIDYVIKQVMNLESQISPLFSFFGVL